MGREIKRKRLAEACAVVALVVCGVLGVCLQATLAEGDRTRETFTEDIWEGLGRGMDETFCLQQAGLVVSDIDGMPDWVRQEVFCSFAGEGWFSNEDWSVSGFVRDGGSIESTAESVATELERRGWVRIDSSDRHVAGNGSTDVGKNGEVSKNREGPSGQEKQKNDGNNADTFIKKGGTCRWLMATYVQVGDATTVVLRIQRV